MIKLAVLLLVLATAPAAKPLSVLLTTGLYTGHLFPLVSLGEELVRRGHNVSLCANVLNGSTLYPGVPERVGIKFVSAGYDVLTLEEFEEIHMLMQTFNFSHFGKVLRIGDSSYVQIRDKIEELGIEHFDVIVSEMSMYPISVYFHKLGKKSLVFSTLMPSFLHPITPEWPIPLQSSDQSDDLNFVERLTNAFLGPLVLEPMASSLFWRVNQLDPHFKEVLQDDDIVSYPGLQIPLIFNTVPGFTFPWPRYPLVEYVGPVLMHSPPHLDKDLQEWLDAKAEKSVIYISMGTTASLTSKNALLDGVMATPYFAVWVVKAEEEHKFSGFEDRLYLASWVPQQTVLKHSSILMSILHCGLNGVQESLYNSLPIICIPFGYDQFEVAAKVVAAGIGFSAYSLMDSLFEKKIKAEKIEAFIHTIVSENYARCFTVPPHLQVGRWS